jgi:creatinine amidohydrolase
MRLAELSWVEAREAIRGARVALLPIGATEQHGPHLPLGTDWFIAERIAERASEAGGWLVLPAVPVGVSEGHRQFWGTLWLCPDLLRAHVVAIARVLAFHDLRRIVFVNGHGGNCAGLDEAVRILHSEHIHAYVHNWWIANKSLLEELFPDSTAHAGSMETSAMLAIDPSLVNQDRFKDASSVVQWGKRVEGVEVGMDTIDFSEEGNVGDPSLADPEKGRALIEAAAEGLDRFCTWLAEQPEDALAPKPHKT